jgi:hypothetical protein
MAEKLLREGLDMGHYPILNAKHKNIGDYSLVACKTGYIPYLSCFFGSRRKIRAP